MQFNDFMEVCSWIIENDKPLDLFAIQVWNIWNQRNKLRTSQACCLTKDLQQRAEESLNEIRSCNLKPDRIRSTPKTKWTAPSPNTYKINYDGAISSADNKSGIGVVVRDCRGEVIASLVQQLDQAFQPMEVVAMAACRAVEFGSELGLHNVIVKGDSELIVKALRYKDNGLASYAHLINDVLLFFGLFSELSYSHLRRNGNKVAHSLVRLSLTSPSCTMWMEDVPSRTLPLFQADLATL